MVEIDNRKATLIAELEVSRGEIRHAFRSCEYQLDLASRLRETVRNNPVTWLSSAALSGWLLSKILAIRLARPAPSVNQPSTGSTSSTRSTSGQAGLFSTLFKMGFELAKPVLLEWITLRVTSLVTAQSRTTDKTQT
jgi:hypothetical protein